MILRYQIQHHFRLPSKGWVGNGQAMLLEPAQAWELWLLFWLLCLAKPDIFVLLEGQDLYHPG